MTKPMSASEILGGAMESGIIPEVAEISRRGDVKWTQGELSYVTWISKGPEGFLTWSVNVGDAKFFDALKPYGGMSVRVRAISEGVLSWPLKGERESLLLCLDEMRHGIEFVRDRADLASLLAEESDVVRGAAYAWQPAASYPARLVQSLVLASDINANDLIDCIVNKMSSDVLILPNGNRLEIRKSAAYWAKQYSKVLGFEIPLPP
ncbi:hypothetical protein [Actinoallomurus iriomotensis]|nr:hypothetical protein [Actinoallomurus iriomotensis]